MKKIVFFGCNGYLGRHLVNYLKSRGYYISGFDIQDKAQTECLDSYKKFNISKRGDIDAINLDVDYVYYFSGITGTNNSIDNFDQFIDVNEKGLLNLLTSLKNRKMSPKIIFPSTRLIYKGAKEKPLDENSEKEFKTIYALNKFHNEVALNMFSAYYDIPYTIFRICVPYGNTLSTDYSYGTIGFFLDQARNNKPITLYGDGNLKRTFTNITDLCYQVVTVSEANESLGEVYNIGGETFSLLQVANLFAKKYGVDVKHIDWPALAFAQESGDTIFETSKIEKLIKPIVNHRLMDWVDEL